jgi:hypothetical protein
MTSTGTTFLNGWTAIRSAGNGTVGATLSMAVTDGSANSGNVYNVGSAGSEERAFGSLGSGTTIPAMGASFLNNTDTGIIGMNLAGTMEQWRSGKNLLVETVIFEYSLDATSLATGTWTHIPAFDLVEKAVNDTSNMALDGNDAANMTSLSASISNLTWGPGSTLWIRWTDANDFGADGMYAIDDLSITVTTGTVTAKPEPSNYPAALTFSGAMGAELKFNWTDASGTQAPDGYLLLLSTNENPSVPVDGIVVNDDLDFSDGHGAKNINQGIQQYKFSNLNFGTTYHLSVFPFTNGGALINYKTDGTAPTASGRTQVIFHTQDFENGLDPWIQFSSIGDQTWVLDTEHGNFAPNCMKITGYVDSVTTVENVDWLISPSLSFPTGCEPSVSFFSAMKYGTGTSNIGIFVSNDYISGDPASNGTWTDLSGTAIFSSGNWTWTNSGFLSFPNITGSNVRVAFKYICDTENAPTWEIDDIVFAKNSGVGFGEKGENNTLSLIYPNPCEDYFEIETKTSFIQKLSIYNQLGSRIMSKDISGRKNLISTAGCAPGVYILELINYTSMQKEVHKLVIR